MAHIGHPLVGDLLYAGAPAGGLSRQALHAFRLGFAHPVTGAPLAFHAPLPADLQSGWAAWGLRYNEPDWLTSQPAVAAQDGASSPDSRRAVAGATFTTKP